MDIKDMHYDYKKKLNKVDSQQYRNLLVPEIDWVLNEAHELFVDIVAEPRLRSHLGFEKSQKNIDDIRTLVESDHCLDVVNNIVQLPGDYKYYIKSNAIMSKGNCTNIKGGVYIKEHDDEFENSPFDKSSFEWRTVNALFTKDGLKVFDDGSFTVDKVCLSYIRKMKYVHNAEDFRGGTYTLPSGTVLTGTQNSELPEQTHREIVDLAVLITTGELQIPDYQIKMAKVALNDLK